VNYVILFQGRAGSSYLIDALGQQPDVTADGEWLAWLEQEHQDREDPLSRLRRTWTRLVEGCPASRQAAWVRAFFGADRATTRAAGFKTKVRDIRNPEPVRVLLEEADIRVIVMHRRNVIKQVVSRLNARRLHERTAAWNLRRENDRPDSFSMTPTDFAFELRRVIFDQRMLTAFADLLDAPRLELEYADLLRDREAWLASIFDFLDVDHLPIEDQVLKNTDDDLSRALENFDELRAAYAGTVYETMFDETTRSGP